MPTEQETQDISPITIRTRILEMGLSVSAVARALKRSRQSVSVCIHHPTINPKLRKKILRHLALS